MKQVKTAKLGEIYLESSAAYDALMLKVNEALSNIKAAYAKVNPDITRFTKDPRIGSVVEELEKIYKETIVIASDKKSFILSEDMIKHIRTISDLKKNPGLLPSSVIDFSTIESKAMDVIQEYLKSGKPKITKENCISVYKAADFLDLEKPPHATDTLKGIVVKFVLSMNWTDFDQKFCEQDGFDILAKETLSKVNIKIENFGVPAHLTKYISGIWLRYGPNMESNIVKMKSLGITPSRLKISYEGMKEGEMQPRKNNFVNISKHLPDLRELELLNESKKSYDLGESAIEAFANHYTKLERLSIKDFDFESLLIGFPELKWLAIINNDSLTNMGLEPACLYPELATLNIIRCPKVTTLSDPFIEGYNKLKSLNTRLSGFSEETVRLLKEKYKLEDCK